MVPSSAPTAVRRPHREEAPPADAELLPVGESAVLLADPDPVAVQVLQRIIEKHGVVVVCAVSLATAWQRFVADRRCRIVLLDWSVEMAGLLERLRGCEQGRYAYVIAMSRQAARGQVAQAMAVGADDVLAKPFFHEVLVQRLQVARRMLSLQDELMARNREQALVARRMHEDLAMAARVQRALLPAPVAVPGLAVAWHYEPCDELGGDLVGHSLLPDGRLLFWILDVSGHGVGSALLAVQVARALEPDALVSALTGGEVAPAAVVRRLNVLFPMDPRTRQYFTIVIGDIDPQSGEARWCCAGHPPPLLVGPGRAESLEGSNVAVGWMPPARARFVEQHRCLHPGERLLLYSDGVIEAADGTGEQIAMEGLLALARNAEPAPLAGFLAGLVAGWEAAVGDGGRADDDLSFLAIEFTGRPPG